MRIVTAGILALLSIFGSLSAFGQECQAPPPLTERDVNNDTRASLTALRSILGSAEVENGFANRMRNVFIDHPETMQFYVILTLYHDGCVFIRDSKTLSDVQKSEQLMKLREQILPRLSLPPAATTSAPVSGPTSPLGFAPNGTRILISVADLVSDAAASPAPSWADKYLRPVPFTFTVGNQWWVDVGYAMSLAEGKKKLAELKAAHPEYDFALYAPFGRNDNWNIVMASWVSKDEASMVLAEAKKINPSSFMWRACSETNGNQCILNRKLRLAMHLRRDDMQESGVPQR